MKRCLSTLCTIIVLFTFCTQFANAASIQPRASEYLSHYTVALAPGDKSGEVKLGFSVTATGSMTQVGISKVEIYKSSGSHVTTIYGNTVNRLLASSTDYHIGTYTYSGTSGVSYYAKVTVYAKDSTGSDYRTVTTATAKAP